VIKLVLEYDGTGFSGWQVQPGRRTVQAELEAALAGLAGEKISATASGRTDAGVHALGQAVSFCTGSKHPPDVFRRGLNALLPEDVTVLSAEEAPEDFHARNSALGKWYRYLIMDRPERTALDRNRVWHVPQELDATAMRAAAACLVGEHDFQSFRSASCEAKTSTRHLRRIDVFRDHRGRLVIEMWGTAFLKQMARIIVGTLFEVGSGRRAAEEMREILEAGDRKKAGVTAPAQGLYLVRVDYDTITEVKGP